MDVRLWMLTVGLVLGTLPLTYPLSLYALDRLLAWMEGRWDAIR